MSMLRILTASFHVFQYQPRGNGWLASQGLATWNGTRWNKLRNADVRGSVNALLVNGTRLYVGGRFSSVAGKTASGLAVLEDGIWSDVGGGVSGGTIDCVAVNAEFIMVGGSFSSAGGTPVSCRHIRFCLSVCGLY
jgi:hypothetical protein